MAISNPEGVQVFITPLAGDAISTFSGNIEKILSDHREMVEQNPAEPRVLTDHKLPGGPKVYVVRERLLCADTVLVVPSPQMQEALDRAGLPKIVDLEEWEKNPGQFAAQLEAAFNAK